MKTKVLLSAVLAAAFGSTAPVSAAAPEKIKLSVSFVGLWDTSQPTMCKERGAFEKAGLDVEIVSTRGGSETVQGVVAGGMDMGYAPGLNAVLAAYAKGANIKLIGTEFIGQNDTYLYVPPDSPIKTVEDLAGKKVAYPRPGGATEAMLLGLMKEKNIKFEMVATGGLDATHTMTMTGQVDVGYSFPPYGIERDLKKEIRIVVSGDAVTSVADVSGRGVIVSDAFLASKRGVIETFMKTMKECIDWSYANKPAAAEMFAKISKTSPEVAIKSIEFYPRKNLVFGPIHGMDSVMADAVAGKFIEKPFTPEEMKSFVDIIE